MCDSTNFLPLKTQDFFRARNSNGVSCSCRARAQNLQKKFELSPELAINVFSPEFVISAEFVRRHSKLMSQMPHLLWVWEGGRVVWRSRKNGYFCSFCSFCRFWCHYESSRRTAALLLEKTRNEFSACGGSLVTRCVPRKQRALEFMFLKFEFSFRSKMCFNRDVQRSRQFAFSQ